MAHSDLGNISIIAFACRSCRRMEEQQHLQHQQQQNANKELLEAIKQQYIEFMTQGQQLDNMSAQDPTSLSQTHPRYTNRECHVLLPLTDCDAHKQLQQPSEQHPEQRPARTQQGETPCLSRPQQPCEDMMPAMQTPTAVTHGHRGKADRCFSFHMHERLSKRAV